jgi:hypothetical protein
MWRTTREWSHWAYEGRGPSPSPMWPPAFCHPTRPSQVMDLATGDLSSTCGTGLAEPVEPGPRRARVEAGWIGGAVFLEIEENVDERPACLVRSGQLVNVVAVCPDLSFATRRPVDGAGYANGQPTGTGAQGLAVACLDDEVQVIALDRELGDTEAVLARGGQGRADRGEQPGSAERGQSRAPAHGHVHRRPPIVRTPAPVRHPAALPRGSLAPGSLSRPSPGTGKLKGDLTRHCELTIAAIKICVNRNYCAL